MGPSFGNVPVLPCDFRENLPTCGRVNASFVRGLCPRNGWNPRGVRCRYRLVGADGSTLIDSNKRTCYLQDQRHRPFDAPDIKCNQVPRPELNAELLLRVEDKSTREAD